MVVTKIKLKNTDGKVNFLLRAGKDLVANQMALASAQHIIDNGKVKTSNVKGYIINVDDKWYFEGTVTQPNKPTADKKEC